jgi:hypothetical protein
LTRVQAKKVERDKLDHTRLQKSLQDFRAKKKQELDDNIERSWKKRECFLMSSTGENMGILEEQYRQAVWERALSEGDMDFVEVSEFLEKMTQQELTMPKRAQETFGTKTREVGLAMLMHVMIFLKNRCRFFCWIYINPSQINTKS